MMSMPWKVPCPTSVVMLWSTLSATYCRHCPSTDGQNLSWFRIIIRKREANMWRNYIARPTYTSIIPFHENHFVNPFSELVTIKICQHLEVDDLSKRCGWLIGFVPRKASMCGQNWFAAFDEAPLFVIASFAL